VIHALGHWGALSLGPPSEHIETYPGWLYLFLVEGDTTGLRVEGDREAVERVRGTQPATTAVLSGG
jgi:hypothetical protein